MAAMEKNPERQVMAGSVSSVNCRIAVIRQYRAVTGEQQSGPDSRMPAHPATGRLLT
jgi:hypothetical protein